MANLCATARGPAPDAGIRPPGMQVDEGPAAAAEAPPKANPYARAVFPSVGSLRGFFARHTEQLFDDVAPDWFAQNERPCRMVCAYHGREWTGPRYVIPTGTDREGRFMVDPPPACRVFCSLACALAYDLEQSRGRHAPFINQMAAGVYKWTHSVRPAPDVRLLNHGLMTLAEFERQVVEGDRGLVREILPDTVRPHVAVNPHVLAAHVLNYQDARDGPPVDIPELHAFVTEMERVAELERVKERRAHKADAAAAERKAADDKKHAEEAAAAAAAAELEDMQDVDGDDDSGDDGEAEGAGDDGEAEDDDGDDGGPPEADQEDDAEVDESFFG